MTAHLLHAAVWLLVLAAQWLRFRPAVRRRAAACLSRRWLSTCRTLAALRRAAFFHPYQPHHERTTR
ncbi:hypothetical protein [Streptosporangium sp. NPDC049078]|uniref:hypothetical protein n=1 Tax=Streptosporangium sp. NPDC049078 TaxID=3155767 RepID=UPI00342AF7DE